jgi:hypothetical protein
MTGVDMSNLGNWGTIIKSSVKKTSQGTDPVLEKCQASGNKRPKKNAVPVEELCS